MRRAAFGLALLLGGPVLGLALAVPAQAEAKRTLVRSVGGAEVDWEAGTVSVQAGAAADLRFPSPDAARPAARRAAEKTGAERLAEALRTLPLGGGRRFTPATATQAVTRAKVTDVAYQSNGGVLLTMELAFADLDLGPASELEAKIVTKPVSKTDAKTVSKKSPPPAKAEVDAERAPAEEPLEISLAVASMPLEVRPRLYSGGQEHAVASAVYRLGEPPKGAGRIYTAKRDRQGRLTFAAPAAVIRRLNGARATIFLRSVGK